MTLVNKVIPGFWNGISQQSPVLRLDTQCEDSVNTYGTLVDGLIKRYPTEHVAVLDSVASTSSYIHTINRDTDEQYNVVFTGSDVEVFKLSDGTKCTVRYGHLSDSLVFTSDAGVKSYITTTTPISSLKATTVSDYTLITNSEKVCAMDGVVSASLAHEALIFVKNGVASTDYHISLNGTEVASYTTGVSTSYDTYKTSTIANALYGDLSTIASNQLKIDCRGLADTAGTITVTIEGAEMGGATAVSIVTDGEGGVTVDTIATAQAIYNKLNTYINPANFGVYLIGDVVYVKRFGYATFVYSVTHTGTDAPEVTAPNSSSQWNIDYEVGASLIKISRLDGADFLMSVSDSWGNQALQGIKGSIQNFTDLPAQGYDGFKVEIVGSPDIATDNYWVEYIKGNDTGVWQEIVAPGLVDNFDVTTVPHRLVRTALNEFTFCPILWEARKAGDDTTNPEPSFIGKTIRDIFFYRNRLGFLSGENFILSRAGDFFNFWGSTATAVLDDDNIDYAVSSNEVSTLYHATPFNTSLLCFSDRQQFQVGSGQATLTAKSITADPTTHFSCNKLCKPTASGSNVFFVSPRGDSSSIREYFVQPGSLTNDASDITAHVPTLLPSNISRLSASSILETVVCLSQDDPTQLYIYKYFWNGDEKAQSAWFKWNVDGTILSADFVDSYLYLVILRDGQVCLEGMRFERFNTGDLTYRVQLDRQVALQGVYDGTNTTWTTPYNLPDDASSFCVVDGVTGRKLEVTRGTGNTLAAVGQYTLAYVGETYEKRHKLTECHLKAEQSNVAIQQGNLIMRTLTLSFTNTGYFRVEVTPQSRETVLKEYNAIKFGDYTINTTAIATETVRFPVNAKAEKTVIELVNDSHLPSEFQAGSYEGTYISRSRSI